MGFLDVLRQSADELAQKAAEAGRVGAARLEELAARRRVDALLRDLGALAYAERTGRAGPDAATEVDRLVEAVRAVEARADAAAAAAEEAESARSDEGGGGPDPEAPPDVADAAGPVGTAPPVAPDDDSPLP